MFRRIKINKLIVDLLSRTYLSESNFPVLLLLWHSISGTDFFWRYFWFFTAALVFDVFKFMNQYLSLQLHLKEVRELHYFPSFVLSIAYDWETTSYSVIWMKFTVLFPRKKGTKIFLLSRFFDFLLCCVKKGYPCVLFS